MYYILVRFWSLAVLIISMGLIIFGIQLMPQGSEVGLMLGCGSGIILWLAGVVALSAWLQPKKPKNYFGNIHFNHLSRYRR
jgi:hypothetical protein